MVIEIHFRVTIPVHMDILEKGLDYMQSCNPQNIKNNSSNKYNTLITAQETHSSAAIIIILVVHVL